MNKLIARVLVLLAFAMPLRADLIDTLDTTANFFNSFGGTVASNNLDGTVSLFRTVANQDAGIDWRNGASNLSILDEQELTVVPVGQVSGGFWSANILFFSNATFVAEQNWISDTNLSDVRATNIAAFADSAGVGAANVTDYYVRFRIQPFDQQDVGFTFTTISAVPEPGLGILFLLGGSLLMARRQRRPA